MDPRPVPATSSSPVTPRLPVCPSGMPRERRGRSRRRGACNHTRSAPRGATCLRLLHDRRRMSGVRIVSRGRSPELRSSPRSWPNGGALRRGARAGKPGADPRQGARASRNSSVRCRPGACSGMPAGSSSERTGEEGDRAGTAASRRRSGGSRRRRRRARTARPCRRNDLRGRRRRASSRAAACAPAVRVRTPSRSSRTASWSRGESVTMTPVWLMRQDHLAAECGATWRDGPG